MISGVSLFCIHVLLYLSGKSLYTIPTGKGIAEDSYFGGGEGEDYKEDGDDAQRRYGDKGVLAYDVAPFEESGFVNI